MLSQEMREKTLLRMKRDITQEGIEEEETEGAILIITTEGGIGMTTETHTGEGRDMGMKAKGTIIQEMPIEGATITTEAGEAITKDSTMRK
jgi:hypothetical protein